MDGQLLGDDELIQRVKKGDAHAYEELVQRYQDAAYRTAYLVTGSTAEAEDAAQEGFVKAYYAIDGFRSDGSFRPWLLAIVANEARTRMRSVGRREALELRLAENPPERSAAPSPEEEALARAEARRVAHALSRLSADDRLIIGYRYFLELSEKETAVALGIRLGTVKSRLSRALARLRQVIEKDERS